MSRPRADDVEDRAPGRLTDGDGQAGPARAVLFSVLSQGPVPGDHFDELAGLCATAGIEPVARLAQVRRRPTPSHYLGKGKSQELRAVVETSRAEVAVCDEELAPVQGRNLEKALGVRVLDRSELILSIFAEHARSRQARLQVELAQRRYQLPRLRRLWTHLDRERGGTRALGGMGEKQIDIDRRLLGDRIRSLRRRLGEIEERKRREIDARRREFLVSLVGYTNTGKSTLMNLLTDAGVAEEDRLFSTLDTRTRRWDLGEARCALLSDTVGFIRKIPHDLVASFHATLAEALEADLLLVVADVSEPRCEERIETVLGVLAEIGASGKHAVTVLNKVDALGDRAALALFEHRFPGTVAVSARTGEGRDRLESVVRDRLEAASREAWVAVPHERSALHGKLRSLATVLDVRYEAHAACFHVLASPAVLQMLDAHGAQVRDHTAR